MSQFQYRNENQNFIFNFVFQFVKETKWHLGTWIAHLNIDSLRNKFDGLISQTTGSINILMISKTKLDESIPIGQFVIESFGLLYRVDWNGNSGGIMLFVREDVPSKLLSVENYPTKAFFRWNKPKRKEIVA